MSPRDGSKKRIPSIGTFRIGVLAIGVLGAGLMAMVLIGLQLGPASGQDKNSDRSTTAPAAPLDTETVERGDLSETKDATGNLGHGDSWAAPIETTGVVTKRHEKGTIVDHGEPLIWINNQQVTLAAGETPVYRTLQLIAGGKSKLLKGDDVRQLQEFLLEKGFNDRERLTADGEFGISTKRAVIEWQKDLGRERSGTVDRTQLMFHPTALRIESVPRVGSGFESLSVTEGAQRVTAQFDTKSRAFLEVGSKVSLDLGDDSSVQGTITEVTATIGDDGRSQSNVAIEPDSLVPAEVERIKVTVSRELANDALIVPVRAIVALAGGGYGVEILENGQPTLTRVELGAVVEDRAEITGEVHEGDEVVVPVDILGDDS